MTGHSNDENKSERKIDLEDEAFQEEFVRYVLELGEQAGDWRDHIAYEDALVYEKDEATRAHYREHVDACAFCQELIDTLLPEDPAIGRLNSLVTAKRRG